MNLQQRCQRQPRASCWFHLAGHWGNRSQVPASGHCGDEWPGGIRQLFQYRRSRNAAGAEDCKSLCCKLLEIGSWRGRAPSSALM